MRPCDPYPSSQVMNDSDSPQEEDFPKPFNKWVDHKSIIFTSAALPFSLLNAPHAPCSLTPFQRLCVVRCFRPDRLMVALRHFIIHTLGEKFVTPPPFSLDSCYAGTCDGGHLSSSTCHPSVMAAGLPKTDLG